MLFDCLTFFIDCNRQSGGYTMPVSVPINPGPYGDPSSMLHASPQMGGHSSVSPRPSSSSGMLDVGGSNNGYSSQPTSSPLPESPTPTPPSALRSSSSMANRSLSPQQHLAGTQRHNLRLAIPAGNQGGLAISSHDRGTHSSTYRSRQKEKETETERQKQKREWASIFHERARA